MLWGQREVIGYHTGSNSVALADQLVGNADYQQGGSAMYAAYGPCTVGRTSLGILSVAILGVMFFYVATRGRQL